MLEILKTFVIGIFVGIANVIPGVSGGTLIVVFNIYDKFVNAITLNVKKLVKNWKFVVPIILGMAVGILIFSKSISLLFINFPIPTNFFFTGLILGSIPLLSCYTFKSQNNEKLNIKKIIYLVISIIFGITLIILFNHFESITDADKSLLKGIALPKVTISLWLKLFLGGFLGAIAMIIPGISGALLMLILGVYGIVISAISEITGENFMHSCMLLIPAGLGILLGLFVGAKIISILLAKVPNYTYAVILGLIIGSAIILFPGFENSILRIIIDTLCLAFGFCLAFFTTKFSKQSVKSEEK